MRSKLFETQKEAVHITAAKTLTNKRNCQGALDKENKQRQTRSRDAHKCKKKQKNTIQVGGIAEGGRRKQHNHDETNKSARKSKYS